jgi:hypothetical protein
MAAHKGPASSRPRCTLGGSSVAAIPVYQSMYQLHNTCTYVESKFKTPNSIRISRTLPTKVHQLAVVNDFMCYIYVALYFCFIPFHTSQT